MRSVCPLSVLSNWEKQINDHVAQGNLTVYTYHGEAKGVTATTLSQYDVSIPFNADGLESHGQIVLTTYQTVAVDLGGAVPGPTASQGKKRKQSAGPLSKVAWKRVVADEGHVLRNPKAKSESIIFQTDEKSAANMASDASFCSSQRRA